MSSGEPGLPALIVLAKAPIPGQVKTRCSPPCTPEQAAQLARASLDDTLRTVLDVPASRRVVVLDGDQGDWLPAGFEVIPQRTGSLGERLDGAFADVGGPAILVAMDTPQLDAGMLAGAARQLATRPGEALVGPADDGGFWGIGLSYSPPGLFAQVSMSRDDTCRSLLDALAGFAIPWTPLAFLTDFDDFETACAIAQTIPTSAFAAAVRQINAELGRAPSETFAPEESR